MDFFAFKVEIRGIWYGSRFFHTGLKKLSNKIAKTTSHIESGEKEIHKKRRFTEKNDPL